MLDDIIKKIDKQIAECETKRHNLKEYVEANQKSQDETIRAIVDFSKGATIELRERIKGLVELKEELKKQFSMNVYPIRG